MSDRTALAAKTPRELGADELDEVAAASFAHLDRLCGQYPSKLNRGDAIRRKCIDCCGGMPSEVRACEVVTCPLWPFRMGDDPFRAQRAEQPLDQRITQGTEDD